MYIKKSYIKIFIGVHYVSSVGVEDVLSFYHRTVINTNVSKTRPGIRY